MSGKSQSFMGTNRYSHWNNLMKLEQSHYITTSTKSILPEMIVLINCASFSFLYSNMPM